MSATHIPVAMRRAVVARARNCCEYCGIPDDATLVSHEVDHVIAERHQGRTVIDNLAYTCFRCNRLKGADLASLDPQTGTITRLFNPRTDLWDVHFQLRDAVIEPLTDVGRTTVAFLEVNDPQWLALRAELIGQDRYRSPVE